MQGFADFDLEAFAGGELKGDVRRGHECVEDLVRGTNAHDYDIVFDVRIGGLQSAHGVLVDAEGVGIVDSAVAGDDELRGVFLGDIFHVGSAEGGVGGEDVGDAFCGVEACDLDDELAVGVGKSCHPVAEALGFELVHVVLGVPVVHCLVQAVEPISCGRQVSNLRGCNRLWNEFAHRMTDKHIGLFDVAPDPVPDFRLRGSFLVGEVGADLDVRTEDDGPVGILLFGDSHQTGHLGVVYDDDMGTAFASRCKRASFTDPVALSILSRPAVKYANLLFAQPRCVFASDIL